MREPSSRLARGEGWLGLLLLGGALPAVAAHAQSAAPPQASAAAPLVFRGVTVIDVRDGQRLPNRTVTIVDRRIQTITSAREARVPRGAQVVDAQGKYLIPGLWDLHVHPQEYVDIAFPLFIANGVTGVRDAGSPVPLATLGQWKREIAAGTRVGPRYLVSGPPLNGYAGPNQTTITFPDTAPGWRMHAEVPLAVVPYVIDSLHAAGADFLKLYGMPREIWFAMAAEARRQGIPFGGHVVIDGLTQADSGATFLDHDPGVKACEKGGDTNLVACTAAAQRLRRDNTWVTVVTQLSWGENLAGQSSAAAEARRHARRRRYEPASWNRGWERWWDSVMAADARVGWREPTATADFSGDSSFTLWHRAGLPLVMGTDISMFLPSAGGGLFLDWTPGFVEHEALVGFVLGVGLTPLEALQTATLNPALALRATDSLGTVEAGKAADLVLLDADPLVDIWNTTKIRAVVANGRYYDRAALDMLLAQAEQAAARW